MAGKRAAPMRLEASRPMDVVDLRACLTWGASLFVKLP